MYRSMRLSAQHLYQFSLAINGVVFIRFTPCFGAVVTLMICCCGFKGSFLDRILAHRFALHADFVSAIATDECQPQLFHLFSNLFLYDMKRQNVRCLMTDDY